MIFQTLFLIAVAGRIWVEFCRIEVLNMQIDFWRIHNVHIWVFRIRSSVILCDGAGGRICINIADKICKMENCVTQTVTELWMTRFTSSHNFFYIKQFSHNADMHYNQSDLFWNEDNGCLKWWWRLNFMRIWLGYQTFTRKVKTNWC